MRALNLRSLTLQALLWRRGASLAVLAAAALASMAAALGPLFARSAEESLLIDRFREAGAASGLMVTASRSVPSEGPSRADLRRAAHAFAATPGLDAAFDTPRQSENSMGARLTRADGFVIGNAWITWQDTGCAGVHVVQGRCLKSPDEVLLSARLLADFGLAVGDRVRVGTTVATAGKAPAVQTVVGSYDEQAPDPKIWGLSSPARYSFPPRGDLPNLDDVLAARELVEQSPGTPQVTVYRPLRTEGITLANLPTELTTVAPILAAPHEDEPDAPHLIVTSDLLRTTQTLAGERDQVRRASLAITAQLVVLAWLVLAQVVRATAHERSGDVALARLRGLSPFATARFALGETTVLLALAAPLGLLLADVAVRALTAFGLARSTTVVIDRVTVLSLGVAFLGGLVAALLVVRHTLRAPILQQLQPVSGSRSALARSLTIDALAVAAAAEAVRQLRSGTSDALALLSPGLLALAGGLLVARIVPLLARVAVQRTRYSARVAGALAARTLARRPEQVRLVTLLTLAVALTVFGVQGWAIARDMRADRARQQLGATSVLHVAASSPQQVLDGVARADPQGRWAMAVAQVPGEGVAVDTARLAAVTAWDPAWIGATMSDLTAALHPPPAAPAVRVAGRLAVQARYSASPGTPPVILTATIRHSTELEREVDLGALTSGVKTYRGELPDCPDGCRLVALTMRSQGGADTRTTARLAVTLAEDAHGRLDAGLTDRQRWRAGLTTFGLLDSRIDDPHAVTASASGLTLVANERNLTGVVAEIADHPRELPAVFGPQTVRSPYGTTPGLTYGAALTGNQILRRDTGFTGMIPRFGLAGALVDLPYAIQISRGGWSAMDYQVWTGPAAPPDARDLLRRAGLRTGSVEFLDQRRQMLDRTVWPCPCGCSSPRRPWPWFSPQARCWRAATSAARGALTSWPP